MAKDGKEHCYWNIVENKRVQQVAVGWCRGRFLLDYHADMTQGKILLIPSHK